MFTESRVKLEAAVTFHNSLGSSLEAMFHIQVVKS